MLFAMRYLTGISLFLLASTVAAAPVPVAGSPDWRRTENIARGSPDWRRTEIDARGSPDWRRSENEARGGTDWKRGSPDW
ncbi:hypothetical protein B0H34DRAFT_792856 [Crassisporium funariophilum]|nr:hypothetical protein B0H34DRAFT_792856 [Crassisporium funariophilum]